MTSISYIPRNARAQPDLVGSRHRRLAVRMGASAINLINDLTYIGTVRRIRVDPSQDHSFPRARNRNAHMRVPIVQ